MSNITIPKPARTLDLAPGGGTVRRFAPNRMGLGDGWYFPAPNENRQGHGPLLKASLCRLDFARLPANRRADQ